MPILVYHAGHSRVQILDDEVHGFLRKHFRHRLEALSLMFHWQRTVVCSPLRRLRFRSTKHLIDFVCQDVGQGQRMLELSLAERAQSDPSSVRIGGVSWRIAIWAHPYCQPGVVVLVSNSLYEYDHLFVFTLFATTLIHIRFIDEYSYYSSSGPLRAKAFRWIESATRSVRPRCTGVDLFQDEIYRIFGFLRLLCNTGCRFDGFNGPKP
jgi:hypothetical protein